MLRKIILAFGLLALLALPGTGTAAGASLEAGAGYHHFDYREDLNPPLKSTESGWLPSAYASYTYQRPASLYIRLYADYAGADLTFDGTTQSGTPVRFEDSSQRLFKFEAHFGYVLQPEDHFQLIPYIGLGHRYWLRGKAKITPTFRSFEEEYSWSYLPVGLKADYTLNRQWSIGATLGANIMFNGKMTARLSHVLAGANDPEFDLGNKVGYYAEMPVTYTFARNWALVGTPWYEYSQIGRSNTLNIIQNNTIVGFAFEPPSRTHQYGLKLGFAYTF